MFFFLKATADLLNELEAQANNCENKTNDRQQRIEGHLTVVSYPQPAIKIKKPNL